MLQMLGVVAMRPRACPRIPRTHLHVRQLGLRERQVPLRGAALRHVLLQLFHGRGLVVSRLCLPPDLGLEVKEPLRGLLPHLAGRWFQGGQLTAVAWLAGSPDRSNSGASSHHAGSRHTSLSVASLARPLKLNALSNNRVMHI